jgi:uncharacterized repeat protein (TIGR03806 family)
LALAREVSIMSRSRIAAAGLSLTVLLSGSLLASAGERSAEKPIVRKPWGIDTRLPWTSSRVKGSPDPPAPYRTEEAFPNLKFDEPLAMGAVPGTNRFGIAERHGKIYTFENEPRVSEKRLLVDVGRTVYGLAFHPRYLENGWVFVTSVLDAKSSLPKGSRISRFTVTDPKSFKADAGSERVILEWPCGGHNGGCIRFGPEGNLYLATGDGSGIADEFQTGQNFGDLLGSILRINVDTGTAGTPYRIPADNPFVNVPTARPEVYSFGHRQVWKFSFDRKTGTMWGGEVGQDLWEMVYIIRKGGNYGWSVNEGSHPFRPERPRGPGAFIAPIVEHPHSDFRSLTGGYVVRGKRLPELQGAYIYGDFDTGKIWMLRYDGSKVVDNRELVDTQLRIVEFGEDARGELFLVDFVGGKIHRMAKAEARADQAADFPRKLSETGLFSSTREHTPAPGVIPYTVNSPLWSDGAEKDRFIALPGLSKIEFEAVTYPQPAPGSTPGWRFPDGTVLVKTFSLEMEQGNPASRRRLETRILHHQRAPGDDNEYGAQVWNGYTYLWNDDQTDAELIEARGLDREYAIHDRAAPGGTRRQTWHFPSRAECALCHTMAAKYVLGVTTLQMNRNHDYSGSVANQLATFDHLGMFTKPLPAEPEKLGRLDDYRDPSLPVDARSRAYLHANCSHCHRKWGGGNADFQLLATLPIDQTGTLNVVPVHGAFGLKDSRYIVPGHPERSVLLHRMTLTGLGRMPHVASRTVDQEGVSLVAEWIRQLK